MMMMKSTSAPHTHPIVNGGNCRGADVISKYTYNCDGQLSEK